MLAFVGAVPRRMTIKPSVALSPAHITLPPDECSGTAPLTADMSKHTPKQPIRMQEQDTAKEERSGVSCAFALLLRWFRHLPDCPRPSAVFHVEATM